MQEPVCRSWLLNNHDSGAGGLSYLFIRVLSSALNIRRTCLNRGSGGVQTKQVIVVGRRTERIGPVKTYRSGRIGNGQHVKVLATEIVQSQRRSRRRQRRRGRTAVNEITFPNSRSSLCQVSGIACG